MDPNTDGFLTYEELTAESEFTFTRENGRKIHCRRIGRREYLALLPVPPEAADAWPKIDGEGEARAASIAAHRKAELAWLRTLPVEEQVRRQTAVEDGAFRAIALAALKPSLTVDEARRLGDDADRLFVEIMKHSGMLAEDKPAADGAAAAPAGEEDARVA